MERMDVTNNFGMEPHLLVSPAEEVCGTDSQFYMKASHDTGQLAQGVKPAV